MSKRHFSKLPSTLLSTTLAIAISTIGLTACGGDTDSSGGKSTTEPTTTTTPSPDGTLGKGNSIIEIYTIAPVTRKCDGVYEYDCLIANNQIMYEPIMGFQFEKGYTQKLKVKKTQVCDLKVADSCPQDVGIYQYELVEVLSRKKVDTKDIGHSIVEVYNIAPNTKKCKQGQTENTCLIVNNKIFNDHIAYFNYENGYNYKIKVNKTKVCDSKVKYSCTGAGMYTYELVEVVSKTQA